MNLVKVDINGNLGLALTDDKGSRVTVRRSRRLSALLYTGVHGRQAVLRRVRSRGGAWSMCLSDGLRWEIRAHYDLLRSACTVARQHVGLDL